MEQSTTTVRGSNDQSVHLKLEELRQEQAQYGEGTTHWALIQEKINHIIAQNYLHYVNR